MKLSTTFIYISLQNIIRIIIALYNILFFSLSKDFAMRYWRDQGAPAEKLLVGFPTYGRTFTTSTAANGLGATATGPASAGPYTREAGFWSYYEVG